MVNQGLLIAREGAINIVRKAQEGCSSGKNEPMIWSSDALTYAALQFWAYLLWSLTMLSICMWII